MPSVAAYYWNIDQEEIDLKAIEGVDAVVHLAGEGVASGRWTKKRKQKILQSRARGTALLMKAIRGVQTPPKILVSASAIGIYGNQPGVTLTEESPHGDDFLAEVCKQWESSVTHHNINGLKTHILRIGIVLTNKGGALKKMLPPFQLGIGGKLGSGQHIMSWIHIDDLIGQIVFLVEGKGNHSVYNGVATNPVSNAEFSKSLGKALSRPAIMPVPSAALKLALGEMAGMLLADQKVLPKNFENDNYDFKYSDIDSALSSIF